MLGRLKLSAKPRLERRPSIKTTPSIMHWDKDIAVVYDPFTKKFYKDSVSKLEAEKAEEPFQVIPLPKSGDTLQLRIKASNTDKEIDMGVIDLAKLGKTITLHRIRGNITCLYVLGEIELPT